MASGNYYTQQAIGYYDASLNEEQAEVWLHRVFEQPDDRTFDPSRGTP
jgi:hypothetical protein